MSEENLQQEELTPELDSTSGGIETPAEETTEETTTETVETPAEETTARGKEAPITQERFDEIYGRMSRAEREIQKIRRPAGREAPKLKPKPREDEFDNYTDFVESLSDWKADNRESSRIAESNKRDGERQQQDMETTFNDNVSRAERADPDFREKGYIHPSLKPFVYDSERFAGLAYYFKDNPNETDRILSLPTANHAAREIGKIEASLGRPKPRTETNAPNKTKPVGSSATVKKKPEDMEEAEYMAYRKKKLGYG